MQKKKNANFIPRALCSNNMHQDATHSGRSLNKPYITARGLVCGEAWWEVWASTSTLWRTARSRLLQPPKAKSKWRAGGQSNKSDPSFSFPPLEKFWSYVNGKLHCVIIQVYICSVSIVLLPLCHNVWWDGICMRIIRLLAHLKFWLLRSDCCYYVRFCVH